MSQDIHLSPSETARRFGVSVKALRLYERRGLLQPLRSQAGWRTYGPDQVTRLHQILALKRLGLPLTRIAALLASADALEPVLALQEQALARDSERLSRALVLVRAARAKLKAGQALSIDDLATLTKETVMTPKPSAETKARVEEALARHFTPEERETIRRNRAAVLDDWMVVKSELMAAVAAGDPTTPAARDIAQRVRDISHRIMGSEGPFRERFRLFSEELVQQQPDITAEIEITPEIRAFLKQALAAA
jgi:DNA-binding transcriptional MerR regulator